LDRVPVDGGQRGIVSVGATAITTQIGRVGGVGRFSD
jgi:hypothetical protein